MDYMDTTSESISTFLTNISYNPDILGISDQDEINIVLSMTEPSLIDNTTITAEPPWKEVLNQVFSIMMALVLVFVTLGMGSHVNFKEVFGKFRTPLPILIGMCGQFIFMPAMAFGISILFKLEPSVGLGTLILSCSPGGTFSNLFTYWIDGDVALSLVMTTCSTILSFGTMPLNLWIYSSRIVGADSDRVIVPYENILTILALVVGPFIVGMTIRYFSERIAIWTTKIASMIGNLTVAINIVFILILFWEMLGSASFHIHASVIILPISGMVITYLAAYISRRTHKVCRTVAIETAAQNVVVAMGVIVLSFTEIEARNKMLLYPCLYSIYMFVEILLGIIIFRLYRRRKEKAKTMTFIEAYRTITNK